MKRFILAACVTLAAAVATATLLEGQDDPLEPSIDSRLDLLADPQVSGADGDLDALREQYLDLMRANVELMSADELREALDAAHVQHREQQAMLRLNDANVILIQIADEFPQTQAANIAQRMLECGEARPRRNSINFDEPVPTRPTF